MAEDSIVTPAEDFGDFDLATEESAEDIDLMAEDSIVTPAEDFGDFDLATEESAEDINLMAEDSIVTPAEDFGDFDLATEESAEDINLMAEDSIVTPAEDFGDFDLATEESAGESITTSEQGFGDFDLTSEESITTPAVDFDDFDLDLSTGESTEESITTPAEDFDDFDFSPETSTSRSASEPWDLDLSLEEPTSESTGSVGSAESAQESDELDLFGEEPLDISFPSETPVDASIDFDFLPTEPSTSSAIDFELSLESLDTAGEETYSEGGLEPDDFDSGLWDEAPAGTPLETTEDIDLDPMAKIPDLNGIEAHEIDPHETDPLEDVRGDTSLGTSGRLIPSVSRASYEPPQPSKVDLFPDLDDMEDDPFANLLDDD
jgi:hypothetical protein